jgi:hypothetical protein
VWDAELCTYALVAFSVKIVIIVCPWACPGVLLAKS